VPAADGGERLSETTRATPGPQTAGSRDLKESDLDADAYQPDNNGFPDAFNAATGSPLLRRQLTLDTGASTGGGLTSNGVAIAENTVFVAATSTGSAAPSTGGTGGAPAAGSGAYVIAYRAG
jgi:hypothetical protein